MRQLLQWKSNKNYIFWVCVCSLRYPEWNAHMQYWHLWSVKLYKVLFRYLIKGTICEKKSFWIENLCFDILYKFFRKISHSKKNWTRYHKCIVVFLWSIYYCSHVLMKLEFSWRIFEKYWIIYIPENLSIGSRFVPRGRAGRQSDITKPIAAFRHFAKAPNNAA